MCQVMILTIGVITEWTDVFDLCCENDSFLIVLSISLIIIQKDYFLSTNDTIMLNNRHPSLVFHGFVKYINPFEKYNHT